MPVPRSSIVVPHRFWGFRAEMAKAPLKLDWKELLPSTDEPPPPELEVVVTAGGEATTEEERGMAELSDHKLQETVRRMANHLASDLGPRLPDKGAKLKQSLRQMQAELDRRKLVNFRKDDGRWEVGRNSRTLESSVADNVSSPKCTKSESRSSLSFTAAFSQKLDADLHKADAAFKEDSRIISRDKYTRCGRNGEQMDKGRSASRASSQPTRMSSRLSKFQCANSLAKKDAQRCPNGNSGLVESPSFSSHTKKNYSSQSPMWMGASVNRDPMHSRPKKIQRVVLLDEEDAQPVQDIHDDPPDEWKEAKVYYPSRDDRESIELSYSDIKCLDPESYLSSPIMNFYIRYLQRPVSPIGRRRSEYHFFNTYFYKKLEEAMSFKGDQSTHFLKLRRWWKGVNIFQKAYIFLPIHKDLHWSLVIICIPAKEDQSGPIVLHLDSLGLHTSNVVFDIVNSYLKQEWNYINQNAPPPYVDISEKIWVNLPQRIEKKKLMVPQQKNEYDCGVFVLYFMERFIEEAPERLRKNDLAMFCSKWFKPEDASGLRKRIRDLLLEEFENARLENGQESSSENDAMEIDETLGE